MSRKRRLLLLLLLFAVWWAFLFVICVRITWSFDFRGTAQGIWLSPRINPKSVVCLVQQDRCGVYLGHYRNIYSGQGCDFAICLMYGKGMVVKFSD